MSGRQINVPLAERYALALAQVALRDECSVPDVVRPVIEQYLDQALADDPDLRQAVEALERSRAQNKARRVTDLTPKRTKNAEDRPGA